MTLLVESTVSDFRLISKLRSVWENLLIENQWNTTKLFILYKMVVIQIPSYIVCIISKEIISGTFFKSIGWSKKSNNKKWMIPYRIAFSCNYIVFLLVRYQRILRFHEKNLLNVSSAFVSFFSHFRFVAGWWPEFAGRLRKWQKHFRCKGQPQWVL